MKKSLLTSIFALAMVVLTGHAWGDVIYTNKLAGTDRTLVLNNVKYQATPYTALTTLTEDDTAGNFDTVVAAANGNNDVQTHSFSMWLKVSTLSDDQILWWVCGGHNGQHGGYAVKAMADGKIRVGKADGNGAWNGSNYITTTETPLAASTWAYVTVVLVSDLSARTATPTVYVNGTAQTLSGTIPVNLNGNGGSATYAQIGSGVTAAGVKVYNEAITAEVVATDYADRTNLTEAPTAITWTGSAGDDAWVTPENWSDNAVPSSIDSVEFNLTQALTITIPDGGATVDYVTVKGAKLTLTGGKLTTGDLVVNSELETPVACIEASNVVLDSSAVLTLDAGAGTEGVGRTTKITGGKVVKKGSALLTLFQPGAGVENAIFDGTTVQIAEGNLKLEIGSGNDPWVKNTTFDFANGTSLLQYGWINGSGTVTLHAGDGVTATAFESNLAQQCILKKTGAGKVTANILGTGPQGAPNNRLAEIQLNEGMLTFPRGDFTAKVTTAADTTLEFTGDAAIENTANNIGGLLKVTSGTVTHNGANRGVNSFEIAEGAQLTSSAGDGLNYNTTTTAKIDGTLYLKNRWTIFAGNAFYLSGTLASDDNNFNVRDDFEGYYCAFDFYNHANNDNNHTKLYVTGPDAQITGRWGAHDSSKTLDVVFNSNDAKLTISKAPTAYQHVTTVLGDGIDSGALAVNFEVVTEKLLTIASGVTLSGTGAWGGPLTLNAGATVDATAGALTVGGTVTLPAEGKVTVNVADDAEIDDVVLNCTTTNLDLTNLEASNPKFALEANGTAVVLKQTPYAAMIGDVKYATFEAAYSVAKDSSEAETITLLANCTPNATVMPYYNTLVLADGDSINLNGYTLTAPNLIGTLAINGGSFETYDTNGDPYTLAGAEGSVFETSNGVFQIAIDYTTYAVTLTTVSGDLSLTTSYTSPATQTLVAYADANITIPDGVMLTLMGNATVEGTLNCSGSIVLGAADATLTTSTELDDKITTTVDGKVVVYADGVYSVGEAAAPTATPWASATVTAGSADDALAMVTLAVEVPTIDGAAIEGLDAETYLGYFTKKAVDNGNGTFTVKAVLNAGAVRPQIATTEGAFVITKGEGGAVSKVAITISNPKKGLCYGIRVKNELSASADSDEVISLIPFSGSSDGNLTVEMDAVEDDVTAMAADAAFFTVVVEPPDAADTVTTTGEGK